jgi:hypothetical protein
MISGHNHDFPQMMKITNGNELFDDLLTLQGGDIIEVANAGRLQLMRQPYTLNGKSLMRIVCRVVE